MALHNYVNRIVTLHMRNFNKQYMILAKFYVNNATEIANQSAKL